MPFLLEILDEQDILTIDKDKIRSVCEKIFADAGVRSGKLNVVLCNSDTSRQFNRDFLHHDYPTDVISFPLVDKRSKHHLEGEVLACSEIAEERAKEFSWSPSEELMLYIVHGVLHIIGFDDTTEELRAVMQQKEREYLAFAGIKAPYWNWDDWDMEAE